MLHLARQNYQQNNALFQQIKKKLRLFLPDTIMIEHVGSTALPQMSGKNIIDILIGVPTLKEMEPIAQQIEKRNFFRGKKHAAGAYIFFTSQQNETTNGDIHLHLTLQNSERFQDFILFKTYLLKHPEVALEYKKLKYHLQKKTNKNRMLYKELKSAWIEKLLLTLKEKQNI